MLVLALAIVGAATPVLAQGTTATGDASGKTAEAKPNGSEFAGLTFGVGLSYTFDTGDNLRVEEAIVDASGVVRINKRNDAVARVMLESHYFFTTKGKNVGYGPFVSVQPGSDEIINALGAGFMFGLRRQDETQSFNIGIGVAVDPVTKTLGREFVPGKPAPLGPDGKPLPIRYETRAQTGILLLASFSW